MLRMQSRHAEIPGFSVAVMSILFLSVYVFHSFGVFRFSHIFCFFNFTVYFCTIFIINKINK